MKKFLVVGNPIEHSLSPKLHNYWLKSYNLNGIYGKKIPIYGDGSQIRNWLYVEDHVNALLKIIMNPKIGETYNISGCGNIHNIDVVKKICILLEELLPNKPKDIINYQDLITFVKDRPGHDEEYNLNTSLKLKNLGWIQKETFDSGLKKTVMWYLKNVLWCNKILHGNFDLKRYGDLS